MKVNWDDMSLSDRAKYVADNAARIFVRAKTDRGWESVSIRDLPDDEKMLAMRRLVGKEHPPYMAIKAQP